MRGGRLQRSSALLEDAHERACGEGIRVDLSALKARDTVSFHGV